MADILSQEEINALLSSLPTDAPENSDAPVKRSDLSRHIKAYDFKHPDKFSKVQLHVLQIIHENLARILTTSLSVQLRTTTHFNIASVEQKTYEEFTRTLDNPTTMLIFRIDPLEGNAIWELSPSTTFLIFDRLLGGVGNFLEEDRELTEIERTVIEKIGQKMLDVFRDCWRTISDFTPSLETIESNPEFTQIVSPSEVVIVVTFDVQIGGETSTMNICLPYLTLKSVSSLLTTQIWYSTGTRQKAKAPLKSIESNLNKVELPVIAELGDAEIKIKDFLDLKEGDAIQLSTKTTDLLKMKIGGNTKFLGKPGVMGNKMSIKVMSLVEEGNGNELLH